MRFSLTGDQAEAAFFVRCIVRSADHGLGTVHIHGMLEERLYTKLPPECRRVASSEEVLISSDTDTVIVADSRAAESIRLVRYASQADYHVVVIPPGDLSTAYSYELHLLLDESRHGIAVLTGSWLVPGDFCPDIQHFDCQLSLPAVVDDSDPKGTLMHAIDACSWLGFANSQVTVLGVTDDELSLSSRQIVLSGSASGGVPLPAITLNYSSSAPVFRLQGRTGQQAFDRQIILPGHAEILSDDLVFLLCERVSQRLPDAAACQAAMEQFSRTLQVVGAVDRSIRRRRTIDVYVDELTERSVFKTQMTTIGCAVLAWLLLGMIGYLLFAQLLKPAAAVMQVMRVVWIAPVVIFLAVQFLLPIARGRQPPADERTTEDNDTNTAPYSD